MHRLWLTLAVLLISICGNRGQQEPIKDPFGESSFVYLKTHKFLIRSQLDCALSTDRKKTFDIKTRATNAIRIHMSSYEKHVDYLIDRFEGETNS